MHQRPRRKVGDTDDVKQLRRVGGSVQCLRDLDIDILDWSRSLALPRVTMGKESVNGRGMEFLSHGALPEVSSRLQQGGRRCSGRDVLGDQRVLAFERCNDSTGKVELLRQQPKRVRPTQNQKVNLR